MGQLGHFQMVIHSHKPLAGRLPPSSDSLDDPAPAIQSSTSRTLSLQI